MLYLFEIENNRQWYFEADDQGIVFRQIVKEKDKLPKLSDQKESEFFLAEFPIDLEDPHFTQLQKNEFESEWKMLNTEYMAERERVKKKYPIGTEVHGEIEVIFPQGIIVDLHNIQYPGIANYEEYAKNSAVDNVHKGLEVGLLNNKHF